MPARTGTKLNPVPVRVLQAAELAVDAEVEAEVEARQAELEARHATSSKRKSLPVPATPTKRARSDSMPPRPLRPQDEELLQVSFTEFRFDTFKSGDITKQMSSLTSDQKRNSFKALEAHKLVTGAKVDASNPKSHIQYNITSAGQEKVTTAVAKLLNGGEGDNRSQEGSTSEED
jgi:hypothetical protein